MVLGNKINIWKNQGLFFRFSYLEITISGKLSFLGEKPNHTYCKFLGQKHFCIFKN
jgi:hypothetical protein